MVGEGGRRLRVAVDGRRWSVEALQTTTCTAAYENRVWPFWAIVGALVGVLVAYHDGGGVGGCGGEQVVVVGGQKAAGTAARKTHAARDGAVQVG